MFKKIKENEKVQKLLELWNNPKTHDITVLMLWLIFILIVIIFVRSMGNNVPKTAKDNNYNVNSFENMKSYDFTYKTDSIEISGQAYDDALLFYLTNKRYYYHNNLYIIDENKSPVLNFDLNVLKINSKMLSNLVSNITPTDNENFKQYVVPLDRFINLYEVDTDVDLSKAATYNVIVSVYFANNEINKVVLDLTNYYVLKNQNSSNSLVTIYYYNINNVSDFKKSYDKILEVER